MLKVDYKSKEDLPDECKKQLSENGSGSEYATYLVVTHNDKVILLKSDAMEPEDAQFSRDLNWIADAIEQVYKIGYADGQYDKVKEVDEFYGSR